jgi:transmembrane sensor
MERRIAKLSAEILEEASTWFIDFNENQVDRAGCEAFNAWLRRSPECVRAFLQVSAFWEDAGAFEKWSKIDTDGLIARTLAEQNLVHLDPVLRDRAASNRVALYGQSREPADEGSATVPVNSEESENAAATSQGDTVAGARPAYRVWRAAAAIFLALGIGIVSWYSTHVSPTYITEIGEQRSITLEDGSLVELNARSRLRVRFTEKQRSVELLEGQALFTVAKNPARPFVVTTSNTAVRAVGTQFDVYRKHGGTTVTVVEGRVAVNRTQKMSRSAAQQRAQNSVRDSREMQRAQQEVVVAAGEQVIVTPIQIAAPASVDTSVVTAWTEKRLIFESAPLSEVVEEFNRYNRRQLVIRDPELFDFHVSGVFPSTDSSRMIEFLRQRFGVTMNGSGDEIELSRPARMKQIAEEAKTF